MIKAYQKHMEQKLQDIQQKEDFDNMSKNRISN